MEQFSKRLIELRKDKKITQKKLAEIVGTNNSSVCDWERGRTEPDIKTIIALCVYFEVSADYLLGLSDC